MSGKSFNYNFGQWKKALKYQKGKRMVCFNTACNSDHKTCNCPILTNVVADNPPQDAASRVGSEATTPAQGPNPPQAPAQSMDSQSGSSSIHGAFTALTEQALYDSRDKFDNEGKMDAAMYGCRGKSNTSYLYLAVMLLLTLLPQARMPLQLTKWGAGVSPHHAQ